jgi:hypothetical protein
MGNSYIIISKLTTIVMKNLLFTLLTFPLVVLSQDSKTLIVHGDTLFYKNLTTGDSIQLTKTGTLAQTYTNKTFGSGSIWQGNAIASTYIGSHSHVKTDITDLGTIPTNTNQLTNGAGFITSYSETDPLAVKISDSAGMLLKYLRKQDTAAALAPYLRSNVAVATYQPIGSYATGTGTANGTNTGDQDLSGKQATLVSNTNIKTVNGTSLLGSGDITQTTVSGNAGTATIMQNTRTINGVSFNGSANIGIDNTDQLINLALGSPFLAQTVYQPIAYCNTALALTDGQIRFVAVYLPNAATITGIKVYSRVVGSYTGDNNNRVGLYTYSAGVLTLVASSANNSSLWTASANAFQTIAFSGTYSAAAGLYFVGILYNNSAQTTAPSLASGATLNNLAMATLGYTNSAKLYGTANGTDLTTPINMSAITGSTSTLWVALY